MGEIGRPRMFKTPEELAAMWEWYKADCDNQMVLTHDFSAKNSEFVSKELKRAITYTIEGFCVYIGISRQSFYDTYADDPEFADIVTRIREACEVDARKRALDVQTRVQHKDRQHRDRRAACGYFRW